MKCREGADQAVSALRVSGFMDCSRQFLLYFRMENSVKNWFGKIVICIIDPGQNFRLHSLAGYIPYHYQGAADTPDAKIPNC